MFMHLHVTRIAPLLVGALVLAFLTSPVKAETLRYGGSSSGLSTIRILLEEFKKSNPKVTAMVAIPGLSSGGGIKAVSSGAIDFSVSSRPLKTHEEDTIKALHFGITPFVFATSINNSVSGLSSAELVSIYYGKNDMWPNETRIRLVLPLKDDIDNALIQRFASTMPAALDYARTRPGMIIKSTDQEQADAIETIPGALGTSTLALIISEKRKLKPLAINGEMPSLENLANRSYPHSKSLYLVVKKMPLR